MLLGVQEGLQDSIWPEMPHQLDLDPLAMMHWSLKQTPTSIRIQDH